MRRKAMFCTVIVAVVMLFCGATFLAPLLDPKTRPGWFILYWLACAWVTVTVVLLAIFDLLLMRVQVRDDGRGFTVDPGAHSYGGHWGLLGMRERAGRIGGTLGVRSAPGEGTEIVLAAPYSTVDAARAMRRESASA